MPESWNTASNTQLAQPVNTGVKSTSPSAMGGHNAGALDALGQALTRASGQIQNYADKRRTEDLAYYRALYERNVAAERARVERVREDGTYEFEDEYNRPRNEWERETSQRVLNDMSQQDPDAREAISRLQEVMPLAAEEYGYRYEADRLAKRQVAKVITTLDLTSQDAARQFAEDPSPERLGKALEVPVALMAAGQKAGNIEQIRRAQDTISRISVSAHQSALDRGDLTSARTIREQYASAFSPQDIRDMAIAEGTVRQSLQKSVATKAGALLTDPSRPGGLSSAEYAVAASDPALAAAYQVSAEYQKLAATTIDPQKHLEFLKSNKAVYEAVPGPTLDAYNKSVELAGKLDPALLFDNTDAGKRVAGVFVGIGSDTQRDEFGNVTFDRGTTLTKIHTASRLLGQALEETTKGSQLNAQQRLNLVNDVTAKMVAQPLREAYRAGNVEQLHALIGAFAEASASDDLDPNPVAMSDPLPRALRIITDEIKDDPLANKRVAPALVLATALEGQIGTSTFEYLSTIDPTPHSTASKPAGSKEREFYDNARKSVTSQLESNERYRALVDMYQDQYPIDSEAMLTKFSEGMVEHFTRERLNTPGIDKDLQVRSALSTLIPGNLLKMPNGKYRVIDVAPDQVPEEQFLEGLNQVVGGPFISRTAILGEMLQKSFVDTLQNYGPRTPGGIIARNFGNFVDVAAQEAYQTSAVVVPAVGTALAAPAAPLVGYAALSAGASVALASQNRQTNPVAGAAFPGFLGTVNLKNPEAARLAKDLKEGRATFKLAPGEQLLNADLPRTAAERSELLAEHLRKGLYTFRRSGDSDTLVLSMGASAARVFVVDENGRPYKLDLGLASAATVTDVSINASQGADIDLTTGRSRTDIAMEERVRRALKLRDTQKQSRNTSWTLQRGIQLLEKRKASSPVPTTPIEAVYGFPSTPATGAPINSSYGGE